ncbi:MAG: DUF551 domain-containing protein [Afipia sp.]|nr:DUF551 domain-containing protein [Afipia sp.]
MNHPLDKERVERAAEDVYAVSCRAIEPGLGMKMCKFKDLSTRDMKLHMDYARAAISAYLGETSGWQPIETAPKNKYALVFCPDAEDATRIMICGLLQFENDPDPPAWYELNCDARPNSLDVEPTHWQPLPSPPFNVNTGSD